MLIYRWFTIQIIASKIKFSIKDIKTISKENSQTQLNNI